ncbi:MAG: hydantoinase/oxoprolinase family protein [Chloroflexi bacterium]|nr:MAG: hydantoinase/oxoprolinase family protein [Chloroflexota bacterium]
MRIGVDVGGTNTDAVLMDGMRVVSWYKTPTTPDVSSGIISALEHLLQESQVPNDRILGVMIGTTHFTNAVVERKRLIPVAAVRLGLPATESLPPMVDWPADLRDTLGNHTYLVHGGHEFDGREIAPLGEKELIDVAADIRSKGLRSVAISSVFSPVNSGMEERAAQILGEEVPDLFVTLSHEIGRIGLLERENAAIMNACLGDLAVRIVNSFRDALRRLQIDAPFYISQNDGTLMNADFAEKYPVLTFASGPTNSMRGAAFLSGVKEAMVVDVGGTTSDVGMLIHGFPRESSVAVAIGGVRTNFRMPDVLSFGLGGGSLVRQNGSVRVGPDSVGYELTTRGLVFGGDTLTTTDVAVAAGYLELGEPARVAGMDRDLVNRTLDEIQRSVDVAVDRMKTSAARLPVILVGGGSILIGRPIQGASEVIKPDHFPVANAIGAAIAQIGGEVDRVFSLERLTRDQALDQAKQEALSKAVEAGADAATVQVVDVDEVPLTYLPSNAMRVRVKAVGDLVLSERPLAV